MSMMGFAAVIASWLGISAGFYKLFSQFDDIATDPTKAALSAMLRRNDGRAISERLPVIFNQMFDRVYGELYLSIRFFIMSMLTTYLVVFAYSLIFLIHDFRESSDNYRWSVLGSIVLMTLLVAVPADAVALTKSRYLLRRLGRVNTALLVSAEIVQAC